MKVETRVPPQPEKDFVITLTQSEADLLASFIGATVIGPHGGQRGVLTRLYNGLLASGAHWGVLKRNHSKSYGGQIWLD